MLRDKAPPSPAPESCKTPLDQNVALGQKLRINGTPVTFFVDGERIVGALPLATIEAKLASAVPPTLNAVSPPAAAAPAVPARK
jgi:thiol:disulfide interchange protein DsbC